MPSSPKSFNAWPSSSPLNSRRSTVVILCSLIGLAGFVFGFIAISRQSLGHKCKYAEPRSVSVVWDKSSSKASGATGKDTGLLDEGQKRHKVMGFVGIQTGFGSTGRRRSLRQTWFPSDHQGLQRLEEATGLAFRFIIGRTSDKSKMAELKKEIAEYDDFLLLDIEEEYSKLPYKTIAFFKAAYALYDSEFYVKADDDIYLRPDRLSLLLVKERSHSQTYLGCMKKGPVFTDPKLKWYEPLGYMLGKEYFLHAYGPIYALSADVVMSLVALRNNSFRMFSNEDVTIGSWMLAMNVNHEDNRQLCEPECTPSSIAVWDIPKCSGLCNPEKKMLELHAKDMCSKSPTLPSDEDD
ncbi:PREDICTED: probable beta-1,3-galactosyltransferase 14 [Nicotiana attenuata]|uniref:Hexosyltransferase n=1 Tax=Nicotiana attenuata TaxID=49451 RepID=A0A314L7E2_NICAT|nr:PREDICTED: probable beta-1,3-galactosyltransferase 14 [Nicotiana attenuata]OIT36989.1 putative beta-1,3-galactosyltransferase 14 [Nicotiana attenuata]